ncbi:MAG: metallophosphoesterase family protein [Persicimonas sp.]
MRSFCSCIARCTVLVVVGSTLACGSQALNPRDPCAVSRQGGALWVSCPDGTQAQVRGDQLCMSDAQGNVHEDECHAESARFGFGADLHYADHSAPNKGHRSIGEHKLREAIDSWNAARVDLAIMGGDYIDPEDDTDPDSAVEDLRYIERIFATLEAPYYHVLGNHDLDVFDKKKFVEETVMERPHYSFDHGGFHFVVLDANYTRADDDAEYDGNGYDWGETWINPTQLAWLEEDLRDADLPTLVFSHQCLSATGVPYVNNAPSVRRVLEASGKVVGVFNGHAHRNDRMVVGDIPYFTMQAMTPKSSRTNAHAVVRVYEEGWIFVEGSAYQASYLHGPSPNFESE